jgi:hypothetical protein
MLDVMDNRPVLSDEQHPEQEVVMTPYAATQLVNRALKREGIVHPKTGRPKEVDPSMLYLYASKGKFKRMRAGDGTGRWTIDRESFDAWLEGYISRIVERQIHRRELSET